MPPKRIARHWLVAVASTATVVLAGYSGSALCDEVKVVRLSGDQQIPPVATSASGVGTFIVGADRSVSGSVIVSGMSVTVAHIHEAPAGKTGPIIILLTRVSDNVWTVPPGATLTEAQYESYRAGNLYFNMHSAANKGGEIRAQLTP